MLWRSFAPFAAGFLRLRGCYFGFEQFQKAYVGRELPHANQEVLADHELPGCGCVEMTNERVYVDLPTEQGALAAFAGVFLLPVVVRNVPVFPTIAVIAQPAHLCQVRKDPAGRLVIGVEESGAAFDGGEVVFGSASGHPADEIIDCEVKSALAEMPCSATFEGLVFRKGGLPRSHSAPMCLGYGAFQNFVQQ